MARRCRVATLSALLLVAATLAAAQDVAALGDRVAAQVLGSPQFSVGDVADAPALAARLIDGQDPLAAFLRGEMDAGARREISRHRADAPPARDLALCLAGALNKALQAEEPLYRPERFAGIVLSDEAKALLAHGSRGAESPLMRRRLLECGLGEALVRPFREPKYVRTETQGWRPERIYAGSLGTVLIDGETGQLAGAYLDVRVGPARPVSQAKAEANACKWLAQHGLDIDGWELTAATARVVANDDPPSYRFEWRRPEVDGVRPAALTTVGCDGSGRIKSVLRIDRPTTVDPNHQVSRQEVERLAKEAIEQPAATVSEAVRDVWFSPAGQQQLRWRVDLEQGGGHWSVMLDARTGDVIHIAVADAVVAPERVASPKGRAAPGGAAGWLAAVTMAAGFIAWRRGIVRRSLAP